MSAAKELIFEQEARKKLLAGIDQIADVLSLTLGPTGLNIGIENYGLCKITSDSNAIIDELEVKDEFSNMGIALSRQLAEQIKEKCGDGRASGILIFQKMVQEGIKNIASSSAPIELKRELDKALELVLREIESLKTVITKDDEILKIATVSASGNEEIGKMVFEAFKKANKDGVISVETATGVATSMETAEGMELERGYCSPYFCTNAEKMTTELNNAKILICENKLSSIQEILPVLNQAHAASEELLIIADDIENELLATLVVNKLKGVLKIAAIKAPSFGDEKKAILEEVAILTGGKLICEETGTSLKNGLKYLGSADKIIISKDKTSIIGGKGKKEHIANRINQLEHQIEKAENSYDKEKLKKRKAKLQGGVVIIKVGATTDSELKQKKQVYEDAIGATRAALEEGIVPGGGLTFFKASQSLNKSTIASSLGTQILSKALEAPLRQIIKNTGHEDSLIIESISKEKKNVGYNALTEKLEDFEKSQIFDPVKVVKNCVQLAVSMAGVILLSEVLIVNAKEE